jgi:hypothetical protein
MKLTRTNLFKNLGAALCFIGVAALGIKAFLDGEVVQYKPILASFIFIGILLFNN